jgi:hypothetical protein
VEAKSTRLMSELQLSACVIAQLSFTNQFSYARSQAQLKIRNAAFNDGPKHV